jgi:hypothetical protein
VSDPVSASQFRNDPRLGTRCCLKQLSKVTVPKQPHSESTGTRPRGTGRERGVYVLGLDSNRSGRSG